jgi:tetratricopeptide (TPR) repeat protein
MNFFTVIPSGVENGADGKPRHRREGRRLSEREVSEIKSRGATPGKFHGVPRLRGVYPERAKRVERASLGLTANRTLTILFSLAFGIASVAYAQPDSDFTKANQEYAQGHFKEAISGYEALVRSGQWSANLFYDLGNAYFRTGDFGRAILNYERALALDRHHPEATANLQIARDEARALELQQGWPERHLQFASVNQYSIAAAIAFWLAIFAAVILIFARRRSATVIAMLIFCLLASAVAIYAAYAFEHGPNGSALAIVTGKEVQARLATADTANSVLALPPGSEVKILSTRGDWIYAALPNSLRGWIPAKNAEQVRL